MKKRKTLRMAEAAGMSEKAWLEKKVAEAGSIKKAAEKNGLTKGQMNWGATCTKAVFPEIKSRNNIANPLKAYNEANGTSYGTYAQLVRGVEIDGSVNAWCRRNELPAKSVFTALDRLKKANIETLPPDNRPSNIPGPWMDTERSPCLKCDFGPRGKKWGGTTGNGYDRAGCRHCDRRVEYATGNKDAGPFNSERI